MLTQEEDSWLPLQTLMGQSKDQSPTNLSMKEKLSATSSGQETASQSKMEPLPLLLTMEKPKSSFPKTALSSLNDETNLKFFKHLIK